MLIQRLSIAAEFSRVQFDAKRPDPQPPTQPVVLATPPPPNEPRAATLRGPGQLTEDVAENLYVQLTSPLRIKTSRGRHLYELRDLKVWSRILVPTRERPCRAA